MHWLKAHIDSVSKAVLLFGVVVFAFLGLYLPDGSVASLLIGSVLMVGGGSLSYFVSVFVNKLLRRLTNNSKDDTQE